MAFVWLLMMLISAASLASGSSSVPNFDCSSNCFTSWNGSKGLEVMDGFSDEALLEVFLLLVNVLSEFRNFDESARAAAAAGGGDGVEAFGLRVGSDKACDAGVVLFEAGSVT